MYVNVISLLSLLMSCLMNSFGYEVIFLIMYSFVISLLILNVAFMYYFDYSCIDDNYVLYNNFNIFKLHKLLLLFFFCHTIRYTYIKEIHISDGLCVLSQVTSFLEKIPANLLAQTSFKCQAYHRALLHIEAFLKDNPNQLKEHLGFMQVRVCPITDDEFISSLSK